MAYGILVPQPGIEPMSPSLKVWSLNHWAAGEVPQSPYFSEVHSRYLKVKLHIYKKRKLSNKRKEKDAASALSCCFQSPSRVRLWPHGLQHGPHRLASLSLTIFQGLPKFTSIASVMPSSHLIFWCPLLLLPSIFPSIRDFSNDSAVRIMWPKRIEY